jgi:ParB-like nuclease family protein
MTDISRTADGRNNNLSFHPLADIFPLMEGAEFDELVADIKANGLREPITAYENKVLDGRNRYRACLAAGIQPLVHGHHSGCAAIGDPTAYVISRNLHRRHLTAEQKREVIAKVIAAQPDKSDRRIAKQVKADHKTVGAVRRAKEATGEVSPVEKRTGADGKARKQPAKKAPKVAAAAKHILHVDPKRDIVREAFDLVLRMSQEQRDEFFDLYLERYGDQKYRGKFTAAWREAKAAPQPKNKPKTPPAVEGKAAVDDIFADIFGLSWPAEQPQQSKRRRGLPPGSKNKAKPAVVEDLTPVENAPSPEASAEIMKAKMAALDDGSDPGPLPDCLRRDRGAP